MAEDTRPRLGRGLAALLGENATNFESANGSGNAVRRLPIEFLRPNPRNPRKAFNEEELNNLVESIREKGVIQPVLARPLAGAPNVFELIAGERRWRAAQKAGLHDLPVIILDVDDKETLELAIIENVQRADLNVLEEALGYEQLVAEFAYTQNDLAKIIGKSRSHIANTMRLLKLPAQTRKYVELGELSAGHARALLAVPDPDTVALDVIRRGMTVRDVEQLGQNAAADRGSVKKTSQKAAKDPDLQACEADLANVLGLKVQIERAGEGGRVIVRYATLEQLDMLIAKLKS